MSAFWVNESSVKAQCYNPLLLHIAFTCVSNPFNTTRTVHNHKGLLNCTLGEQYFMLAA